MARHDWKLIGILMLLTMADHSRAEEPRPDASTSAFDLEGASQFQSASDLFNSGIHSLAIPELEAFRKQFPHSLRAPEAIYKLGCAYLLQGKSKEAQECFIDLLKRDVESPYAQIAVRSHISSDDLLKLADEHRKKARQSSAAADWRLARVLYSHCHTQLPVDRDAKRKLELVYKIGDCSWHAGDHDAFQEAMQALVQSDSEDWSWLAAFRLMSSEGFACYLEDFAALDSELSQEAFLDTANVNLDLLQGTDRLACSYYRACMLAEMDRREEAMPVFADILADHPNCRWAPECLMWLAEDACARGDLTAAREYWIQLLSEYSDSDRLIQVIPWFRSLHDVETNWSKLEQAGCALLARGEHCRDGVSLQVNLTGPEGEERLHFQAVIRDRRSFLIRLAVGKCALLLARNAQGTWYCDGTSWYRSAEPLCLPVPQFDESVERSLSFTWSMNPALDYGDEPIRLPMQALTHFLTTKLTDYRGRFHLHHFVDVTGQERLRLESFSWRHHMNDHAEIVLGPDMLPVEASLRFLHDTGMYVGVAKWQLGPQPEESVAVAVPAVIAVQDVAAINYADVIGQVFRVVGSLTEIAKQGNIIPR